MSSRLFQDVREDKGLAYSVYSYHSSYEDSGMMTIYAERVQISFSSCRKQFKKHCVALKRDGITRKNWKTAKSK